MVNKDKINMMYLDSAGTIHSESQIFFNSIQSYMVVLDAIGNTTYSNLKLQNNIFEVNIVAMTKAESGLKL